MKFYNIEKLINDKIILLLGRREYTEQVCHELMNQFGLSYNSITLPNIDLYFEDYPNDIQYWYEFINFQFNKFNVQHYMIFCQNKEYIDYMLDNKDFNFSVATVRKNEEDIYIRRLTKEEAINCRETFNMEFR